MGDWANEFRIQCMLSYNMSDQETRIQQIHQTFIEMLKLKGFITLPKVEEAFRAIPRHIFVPNVPPEDAYDNRAISTKRSEERGSISSSSAPGLMAQMLEKLDLKDGQRVLEIGAATGYNASLIGYIVGSKGKVVTIDIDQDLVDGAIEHISRIGLHNIEVMCRDGTIGDPTNAPFDRLIITVGVPDITNAWFDQLKDNGILELPLELSELESIHENQPLIVFKKNEDHLESTSVQRSGFMRLRGSSATKTKGFYPLKSLGNMSLVTPLSINSNEISDALTNEADIATTNYSVSYRELFGLQLWFSLRLSNYCHLYSKDKTKNLFRFFTRDGNSYSTVGLCTKDSVSILDVEEELINSTDSKKLVVKTYGKDENLLTQMLGQIEEWEKAGRPFTFNKHWEMPGINIKAYPKNINLSKDLNSTIVEKPSMNLLISWNLSNS
jgi:protein-L-isoaspartate(D-aspartate) O-methyltransferase